MRPRFSPVSLGTPLKSIEAGDFILTEAAYPPDIASRLAMEGLILEMLAFATRRTFQISDRREPRWLQDLCHEHFAEPISLMTLAQTVGIHPGHLARIFRKQHQCTVGEYVRRLRLEYAAQELVRTQKSLSAIALEAGFYDQSHFTNSFKAHMGVTPYEFRSAMGSTS